jgi:hypothetical protein
MDDYTKKILAGLEAGGDIKVLLAEGGYSAFSGYGMSVTKEILKDHTLINGKLYRVLGVSPSVLLKTPK